jgi:hypothetical protein
MIKYLGVTGGNATFIVAIHREGDFQNPFSMQMLSMVVRKIDDDDPAWNS